MSVESVVKRARRRITQAQQMTVTVTVRRPDPSAVLDPDTGEFVPPPAVVYEGPAKIRPADAVAVDVTIGQEPKRHLPMVGRLPPNSPAQKNDIWTVTASVYDAGMVGKVYRVDDAPADGWQIPRVVRLEEVT